jgi:hypothetical protein
VELTINVREARGGKKSDQAVIRSVDDLDSAARRLAAVIKSWLRQVPLTRGASRARFDITAEWTVAVPANGQVSSPSLQARAARAPARARKGRTTRTVGRVGKRSGR